MQRNPRFGLAALTLIFAAAAMVQAPVASAQAPLKLLRVGADPDYRPTSFLDTSGKKVGVDVDFANALAARLGIPLEYIGVAWDGIIPSLQAKKIDENTAHSGNSVLRGALADSQQAGGAAPGGAQTAPPEGLPPEQQTP